MILESEWSQDLCAGTVRIASKSLSEYEEIPALYLRDKPFVDVQAASLSLSDWDALRESVRDCVGDKLLAVEDIEPHQCGISASITSR
eukprot:IDg4843t1